MICWARPRLDKVNYLFPVITEGGEGGDWTWLRRRLQPGVRVVDRRARVVSPTDGETPYISVSQ